MLWEQALARRALAATDVAAIVGVNGAWDERPQWEGLPALVLEVISDPVPQTHDGVDSIRPSRVQANCYARDKEQAALLRNAVVAALLPAGEFDGVWFDRARIENQRPVGGATETGFVFGEAVDFIIWHKG